MLDGKFFFTWMKVSNLYSWSNYVLGWYCRAKAEEAAEAAAANGQSHPDYRTKFRELKKKLKYLVHENEYFKEALKVQQQKLLKVSRDRSYLLDRLSKYEKPDDLSDASDSPDEQPKRWGSL